jgi:hypothetical protein
MAMLHGAGYEFDMINEQLGLRRHTINPDHGKKGAAQAAAGLSSPAGSR